MMADRYSFLERKFHKARHEQGDPVTRKIKVIPAHWRYRLTVNERQVVLCGADELMDHKTVRRRALEQAQIALDPLSTKEWTDVLKTILPASEGEGVMSHGTDAAEKGEQANHQDSSFEVTRDAKSHRNTH